MFYPNILRLLAHQLAVPLERAHKPVHTLRIACASLGLYSVKVLFDCRRLVDHDANRRVPTNSPHDHFATPFLDDRTRAIGSVDSFEAAQQKYTVSSAD